MAKLGYFRRQKHDDVLRKPFEANRATEPKEVWNCPRFQGDSPAPASAVTNYSKPLVME